MACEALRSFLIQNDKPNICHSIINDAFGGGRGDLERFLVVTLSYLIGFLFVSFFLKFLSSPNKNKHQ